MAKVDDASSTSDWIFLREALDLTATALGSIMWARDKLFEWLQTDKLPWTCIEWEALDDAGMEKLRQTLGAKGSVSGALTVTYYNGDPRFFGMGHAEINWIDSTASIDYIAQARGIKVPRARLLELLPGGAREDEEVHGTAEWIAAEAKRMKDANEIPPDISITDLARELARRMQRAAATNKALHPIKWPSIRNKLRDWGLWPVTSIK